MPLPQERPFDDSDLEPGTPSWQPLPGASSHPGASLCWVWLKVLAVGFLLALAVGLIGLTLDVLWV